MQSPYRNLVLRLISAAVLAPLTVLAVWYGGDYFIGLIAIIASIAVYELLVMIAQPQPKSSSLNYSLSLLVFVFFFQHADIIKLTLPFNFHWISLLTLPVILVLGLIYDFIQKKQIFFSQGTIGIFYIIVAGYLLIQLRLTKNESFGLFNIVFLLTIIWATDIGAYFTGRLLKGPKLWAKVSPGKTWAGAIGGIVWAIFAGFIIVSIMTTSKEYYSNVQWIVIMLFISISGQLGDLMESALKRKFGVKDSGKIIPGHGGVLDRIDSVLMAVYIQALIFMLW